MTFNIAGYNGLVATSEDLVNKLLAATVYDPNLIGDSGQVPDNDFRSIPITLSGGGIAHLYLLMGKPTAQFLTHDATNNRISLSIPFIAIGLFKIDPSGGAAPVSLPLPGLGITVSNVQVTATKSLTIDLSAVTKNDISIDALVLHPGLTGVGGTADKIGPVDNNQLNALLGGAGLTADQLLTQIAAQIAGGKIGAVPEISLGADSGQVPPALGSHDLVLFDHDGHGSAEFLLFATDGKGLGNASAAIEMIPASPQPPPFSFAVALPELIVTDLINGGLDQHYYSQGTGTNSTLNTPSAPLGFMLVPDSGTNLFSLPNTTAGLVTVSSPSSGAVQVTIAKGGMPSNARAHIDVLDVQGTSVPFTAAKDGSATVSINASGGDSLGISIDAIGDPDHPDVVVWRPTFTFDDGVLRVNGRYGYIPAFNAEGNFGLTVSLVSDESEPFKLKTVLVDSKYDLPPGFELLDLLVPLVIPGLIGFVTQKALPAIVETALQGKVDPQAQQSLTAQTAGLTGALSNIIPQTAALFLQQVDISKHGVVLSGYGDAGAIQNYDRTIVLTGAPEVELSLSPDVIVTLAFDWAKGLIWINAPAFVDPTSDAPSTFWDDSYDDRPDDSKFQSVASVSIPPGGSRMIWMPLYVLGTPGGSGHAKVLFEWASGGAGLKISWIAYEPRATRSVHLVPNIKRTLVGSRGGPVVSFEFYNYHVTIDLTRVKFFLNDDTQAAGLEQWFWNGQLVPEMGLSLPGTTVTLDRAKRRMTVDLNQAAPPGSIDAVLFKGTDVFGVQLTDKVLLQTPSQVASIGVGLMLGGQGLINPFGPDNQEVTQLANSVAEALGSLGRTATGRQLAGAIAVAINTGTVQIDAATAWSLLLALAAPGVRGR